VRANTHDVVGAVGEGAPVLVAGEHPVVAVAHRAAGDGARSEPVSGSDSEVALRNSPAHDLGQVRRRFSSVIAVLDPAALGTRDDGGHRHPAAGELLADQAVLEDAQAQAAVLFGDGDAEVAHVGHLLAQLRRDDAVGAIELVGHRQHFLHDEGARRLLDHAALVGHVTHVISPFLASAS
jgi:hypothetical protein